MAIPCSLKQLEYSYFFQAAQTHLGCQILIILTDLDAVIGNSQKTLTGLASQAKLNESWTSIQR
uniref:Uncharacterized protein n=1 Tax=Romanomermis culicivorax TaxID=13658 RepID=A0A915KVT2_ROMCU